MRHVNGDPTQEDKRSLGQAKELYPEKIGDVRHSEEKRPSTVPASNVRGSRRGTCAKKGKRQTVSDELPLFAGRPGKLQAGIFGGHQSS